MFDYGKSQIELTKRVKDPLRHFPFPENFMSTGRLPFAVTYQSFYGSEIISIFRWNPECDVSAKVCKLCFEMGTR